MTSHCGHCGSRMCNHGNCPECSPCQHCYGGDRSDKFFGYEEEDNTYEERKRFDEAYFRWADSQN